MGVNIYIKSDFNGNPRGAGKAAAVVEYIDGKKSSHLRTTQTRIECDTRNALYLRATISALRMLIRPCTVVVYANCGYMTNACKTGWLSTWRHDDWKKADGKPLANADEWKQLDMLLKIHRVDFKAYDDRYDVMLCGMLDENRQAAEKGETNV